MSDNRLQLTPARGAIMRAGIRSVIRRDRNVCAFMQNNIARGSGVTEDIRELWRL
jgi:hypothetical protein